MVYATDTTYQYELFRGTLATASATGVKQLRTQERDEPAEAFSAPVDRWVTARGVEVFGGAVMRIQVVELTPGVATQVGDWEFYAYIWDPKIRTLNAVLLNRNVNVAAGTPLRNPLGLPVLRQSDLVQPNQPGSGEPALDQYTGEPNGETVP
jgi:hypothetical protein